VGAPERPGAVGPPESRPQLEELRSGEWVREPGRPGVHATTGPAAAPPESSHSEWWGTISIPGPPPVNPNTVSLADNITRLARAVDQASPLHGRIVPLAELDKTIGRAP